MCARFALFTSTDLVRAEYNLQEFLELFPRYNVAPSQSVLVIGPKADGKSLGTAQLTWGFVPSWAPDLKGPKPVNAKAETIAEKPMFRDSFRKRRCVIPVSGYYEWITEGKKKIPVWIRLKDQGLMTLAGIWDCWKHGSEKLFTCAIVTTEANELTRGIHERMPVILGKDAWPRWLDTNTTDVPSLNQLLKPFPSNDLEIVPANPKINSSKYEGTDFLLQPLPPV